MKIDGYDYVRSFVTPVYTYIEGKKHEEYWVDDQNMWYHFFKDEDFDDTYVETRKYWVIAPFKPKGVNVTKENADKVIKWLVAFSWHTSSHPEHDDVEYNSYEWDFKNHCVKID